MMRLVFAGGGTSGHLVPSIAVAQTLRQINPDVELHFLTSRRPLDAQMLAARGFQAHPISGRGMPYGLSPTAAGSLFHLAVGSCQALRLLRRLQPDALLATGGFISASVVPAARLLRLPIMLHVSDVMPDRTNRLLARWADCISLVSDSVAATFATRRVVVTGQPVRPEILAVDPLAARASLQIPDTGFVILVTGGSQGAQRLNDAVIAGLRDLLAMPDTYIIHLTGTGKLTPPEALSEIDGANTRYHAQQRRDDMGTVLAAADIVVTRAGANGLAEASAWGRPIVTVPYPHAGGHQQYNARLYEQAAAAVVIDDADLTGPRLVETLTNLRNQPGRLEAMAQAATDLGSRNAARAVANHLMSLVSDPPNTAS